jgi:16S rRNA (guanine527-N7)-methyltransferase
MKRPANPGLGVSRETTERLDAYVDLLLRWNRTINLISRRDENSIWQRHIADSLALISVLPPDFSHAIDLGSGGGFPGLVLAIATDRRFHLVESDQRKAAFLREAARVTAAPATVHAVRIEAADIPPAPVITARALAPLAALLDWAAPRLAPGGICVFPKGRSVQDELTPAAARWHMCLEQFANPADPAGTILRISEISRVRDEC